ncbi:Tn3 family transposase [Streptomyces cupreus]|uniref:Tn3 family transposase n=1 Tax=Streptomyces cupreus TaxID=2759956 RepID=UPI003AB961A6
MGFGSGGVITDNDPVEQEKTAKFNALLTNAVIFHNALDIAAIVCQLQEEGRIIDPEDLAHIWPYLTEHIRRFGEYSTHDSACSPKRATHTWTSTSARYAATDHQAWTATDRRPDYPCQESHDERLPTRRPGPSGTAPSASPSGPCPRREEASPGNAGAAGGAPEEDVALGEEEDVALDEGDVAEDIEDSGGWQPRTPTSVVPAIARAPRRVDRLRRSAARGFPLKVLRVMPAVKAAACCCPVCGFRYDDDMSGLVASEYACVDRRGRALYGRGHLRWPAPGSHRGGHRR